MDELLTHDTFLLKLNKIFHVQLDSSVIPLKLTRVDAHEQTGSNQDRIPFALLFSGPADPLLNQRLYEMTEDELGSLAIFLVPVGQEKTGSVQYEAIFN